MNNGFTILITGMPKSGKTTLANNLLQKIEAKFPNKVVLYDEAIISASPLIYSAGNESYLCSIAQQTGRLCNSLNKQGIIVLLPAVFAIEYVRGALEKEIEELETIFISCPVQKCRERSHGAYKESYIAEYSDKEKDVLPFEPPEMGLFLSSSWMSIEEEVAHTMDWLLEMRKLKQKFNRNF